jgi:hypothetical protein
LAFEGSAPKENQEGRWLVFTSTGVYDGGKSLVPQTEYQFIENKKVGYSLSIPKEWDAQKIEMSSGHTLAFVQSLKFSSPDRLVEGSVGFMDLPEKANPQEIAAQYYQSYKKEHPEAVLDRKGKFQNIQGQDGNSLILVDREKKGWIALVCMNKRVYCLELWTKQAAFDQHKTTLENIVLNFQVQTFFAGIENTHSLPDHDFLNSLTCSSS